MQGAGLPLALKEVAEQDFSRGEWPWRNLWGSDCIYLETQQAWSWGQTLIIQEAEEEGPEWEEGGLCTRLCGGIPTELVYLFVFHSC